MTTSGEWGYLLEYPLPFQTFALAVSSTVSSFCSKQSGTPNCYSPITLGTPEEWDLECPEQEAALTACTKVTGHF